MKNLNYSLIFNIDVNAIELEQIQEVMNFCEEISELQKIVNEIDEPYQATYSST
mgnify:CR=1 FL=1